MKPILKFISLAVPILGLAIFLWLGRESPETPPTAPAGVGRPGEGAPLAELAVPAELSAEAAMGRRAFEAFCADCHGTNAAGRDGLGPPLVHRIYEPGHHADMAFVLAVRNGVRSHHWRFGDMAPIEGLTDADIRHITRYVRELQHENGID